MTNDQTAALTWRDGVIPVSTQFDDPYFSIASGLEETRHVFLAGNALPERLAGGFHVAELGFGTGLNLLALALIWDGPEPIKFTSFEAFPMAVDDIRRSIAAFPDAEAIAEDFLTAWADGTYHFAVRNVEARIIIGDARETLPTWDAAADAWFLDGFSPAKNPELWNQEIMSAVAEHTKTGGSFATYTAAGHVRRALEAAGFEVTRTPGYGRKRHMSQGIKTGTPQTAPRARPE